MRLILCSLLALAACAPQLTDEERAAESDALLEVIDLPLTGPVPESSLTDALAAMRIVPEGSNFERVMVEGVSTGRLLILLRAIPEMSETPDQRSVYIDMLNDSCIRAAEGRPTGAIMQTRYPDGGFGGVIVCDDTLPINEATANLDRL